MRRVTRLHYNSERLLETSSDEPLLLSSPWFAGIHVFLFFIINLTFSFFVGGLWPIWLTLLPICIFCRNWIKLKVFYRPIYLQLKDVLNVGQLVDVDRSRRTWDNRPMVLHGASIDYFETDKTVSVTIKPNGAMHSKNIYELGKRLTEIFNIPMAITNRRPNNFRSVTYKGFKTNAQLKVNNHDFY